ncbi:MAG: tryptophan synthase subunit alpha [Omnitrophica bacterium RIFCSPHIGHO2_02_FULL_51_18]|nr:MAG: tryptophan synthase subunit alpha [Omnitrophica bacterium RIFCSPHIGHO2_02_FULL_51_18]
MTRIENKFKQLKKQKKKALIVFITAGDPSLKKTQELIYAFEKEGVDLMELGVPFSDPLADGPVIQAASIRSLERGTTLAKILAVVKKARKKSQLPILLMSYLNPILAMGPKKFAQAARSSGVDGVIVPDLPPDEEKDVRELMRKEAVDLVYLLAPTSTQKRRQRIVKASRGFVYYVSLTGVTGVRKSAATDAGKNISAIKKETPLPVCVGFGISDPSQARKMSAVADGVIIGSSLVKALAGHSHLSAESFAKKFVRPFVKAVHA